MITIEDFKRINNDTYGNPRYVCHYLHFITNSDKENVKEGYKIALKRARKLGGKKYHNKQYGGGIVFLSYSLHDLCIEINKLINNLKQTK